jgi:hypothetical protein
MAITAPLVAAYAKRLGTALTVETTEATLMMRPVPRASIAGRMARVTR